MQKNLCLFERAIRVLLSVIVLYAAYALYEEPIARVIAGLFGLFALGEALTGVCPLLRHLGAKSPSQHLSSTTVSFVAIMGLQIVLSYEWWMSAFEKWTNSEFVAGMPATLSFFASANPFVWFTKFLTGLATTNAELFAHAVRIGETLTALGLFLSAVLCVYAKESRLRRSSIIVASAALVGGLIMSAAFYFAAAWTGPGTHALNVLMFWMQVVLLYFWFSQWRAVR